MLFSRRCVLILFLLPMMGSAAYSQIAADIWAGRRGTISVSTLLGGSLSTHSDATFDDLVFSSSFDAGLHWRVSELFALGLVGGIDNRGHKQYNVLDSVVYRTAHVTYWKLGPRFSLCAEQWFVFFLGLNFGGPLSAEFSNDSRSLQILDSAEVPPLAELAFGMEFKVVDIWHGILFMGFEYGEHNANLYESWSEDGSDGLNSGDPTRVVRLSIGYEFPFYNLPEDDEEEWDDEED